MRSRPPRPSPIALLLLALLLGACGSVERRPVIEREAVASAAPAPARPSGEMRAPSTARPGAGGYYKDDGPGDNAPAPAALAAVQEPEPKIEPLHRFANNPYNVFGVDYVPLKSLAPFRQRGLGSWYGRKFHGQRTSSGEPYDMYAMTAAHPTLPIPSYARVTSTGNGRSVIVRVNDRGPFHPGRVIDLSYTAAWKLGYIGSGSAPVEVELLTPEQFPAIIAARRAAQATPVAAAPAARNPAPEPVAAGQPRRVATLVEPEPPKPASIPLDIEAGGVFLQLGAFSGRDNAENFRARIYRELAWLNDAIEILPRDGLFRLHLGPYRDRSEAGGIAERIRAALELKPVVVVR
jgi:rare lipoprotein A